MTTRLVTEAEYQRLRSIADKASALVRFYDEADLDDSWDSEADLDDSWDSEADRLWIALEEAVEENKR